MEKVGRVVNREEGMSVIYELKIYIILYSHHRTHL